jgi:hypothetical protein
MKDDGRHRGVVEFICIWLGHITRNITVSRFTPKEDFSVKKTILLISIMLISALPIGCTQTAPQSVPVLEEEMVIATPEPVLSLCVICDELKVESEHCFDWHSEIAERNNAKMAESEAHEEDKAAYEAARLEAWNALPEDERDELMAQARTDVEQWWEDLIQGEYDVMTSIGFAFSPDGEGLRKAAPLPDHIDAPLFNHDGFFEEGEYWVRVVPELLSPDNGIIYMGNNSPWELSFVLGFANFRVFEYSYGSSILERYGEPCRVTKGYGGGYVMFEGSIVETMISPLSYVLCISERMWTPECVCELPPDFQP